MTRVSPLTGKLLLGLALALGAAACAPKAAPPLATPEVEVAAPAPEAVAFEPVTGLPADRTALFATELGATAAETGLNIVGRDSENAAYRLKGYLTAESRGAETVLSYVWDIFSADGARVHRIDGEERLPAALPDPWQAVTDDALQAVARRTVVEIEAWVSRGMPVTLGAGEPPAAQSAGARLPT